MNYSVDQDGPGERDHDPPRSIDEILEDLEAVAVNFDNGWRAEPPTMAALVRRIIRELKETR